MHLIANDAILNEAYFKEHEVSYVCAWTPRSDG